MKSKLNLLVVTCIGLSAISAFGHIVAVHIG